MALNEEDELARVLALSLETSRKHEEDKAILDDVIARSIATQKAEETAEAALRLREEEEIERALALSREPPPELSADDDAEILASMIASSKSKRSFRHVDWAASGSVEHCGVGAGAPPVHLISVLIPVAIYSHVVGHKCANALQIVRRIGRGTTLAECKPAPPDSEPLDGDAMRPLTVQGPDFDAVEAAATELELKAAELTIHRKNVGATGAGPAEGKRGIRPTAKNPIRHVFIDYSNILIGAQSIAGAASAACGAGKLAEEAAMDWNIRVNAKSLAVLLETGGRTGSDVQTRVVAGSRPPKTNAMWRCWDDVRYKLIFCEEEEAVDASLRLHIFTIVLEAAKNSKPFTTSVVLAIGGGNDDNEHASFFRAVRECLSHGVRVELWAWQSSCSSRYKALAQSEPTEYFRLRYLDGYKDKITFRQQPRLRQTPFSPAPPPPNVVGTRGGLSPRPPFQSTGLGSSPTLTTGGQPPHGSPIPQPNDKTPPSESLFVSGLPPETTKEVLEAHFSTFGTPSVKTLNLAAHTAVVVFATIDEARNAKKHGRSICGFPIRLAWLREATARVGPTGLEAGRSLVPESVPPSYGAGAPPGAAAASIPQHGSPAPSAPQLTPDLPRRLLRQQRRDASVDASHARMLRLVFCAPALTAASLWVPPDSVKRLSHNQVRCTIFQAAGLHGCEEGTIEYLISTRQLATMAFVGTAGVDVNSMRALSSPGVILRLSDLASISVPGVSVAELRDALLDAGAVERFSSTPAADAVRPLLFKWEESPWCITKADFDALISRCGGYLPCRKAGN